MPWRITYNAVDCGLFVMRHMEMYNDSDIWLNNMKNEKAGQKSQINLFHAKYLAKISLLPYNMSKNELLKEANEEWKKQQKKSKTVTNMDVKALNLNLIRTSESESDAQIVDWSDMAEEQVQTNMALMAFSDSEFRAPQEAQPLISKDKGKCIMIEPNFPLKRKDQIALDEQIVRDIQAKLDAELIEEQKLARKQEEEANIALIKLWENTQAMMEADRLLAERLQSKEREELTNEEKGKLFMELMEKRRKHFAALRAQEKRNRPPTKAQKRTQMSTYLKHMGGYTYKQLKGKSFDEIQKLFDKEMKRVNTFVAMGSEVQESKEKKVEGSEETAKSSRKKMLGRKRAGKEQQQESSKKQRMEEDKESDEVEEVKEVEEDDEGELKKHLVIKKDEDIAIDAIPLATKLPMIIDYKLHKERMLQGIDREDLEALWRIVKTKYSDIRPEDKFERVLWGDLKVMFEPDKRNDVWRILQGYRVPI
ncbi:hypothetical protein Tco_0516429 [Tanacetum coccineum]